MNFKIDRLKQALEICNHTPFFQNRLKESIQGVSIQSLWELASIEGLKPEIEAKILKAAPTCYEINEKVFLLGEVKEGFDYVGDGISPQPACELFDMTQEMKTGDSCSFYVSTTTFFKAASANDTYRVVKFLEL